jgi:hypothetical protein
MELVRCPRCAKEIPDVSRFCRRCGCALSRYGAAAMTMGVMGGPAVAGPAAVTLGNTRAATRSSTAAAAPTKAQRRASGGGAFLLLAVMGVGVAFRMTVTPHALTSPTPPVLEYRAWPIEGSSGRYANWGGRRHAAPRDVDVEEDDRATAAAHAEGHGR